MGGRAYAGAAVSATNPRDHWRSLTADQREGVLRPLRQSIRDVEKDIRGAGDPILCGELRRAYRAAIAVLDDAARTP